MGRVVASTHAELLGELDAPTMLQSWSSSVVKGEVDAPTLLQSWSSSFVSSWKGKPLKRKILFMGAPLHGHFSPMLRLMRWFHEQGLWEVHMVPQQELLDQLPDWVVVHKPLEDLEFGEFTKNLFSTIGREASDKHTSFVQMLSAFSTFPMDAFCSQMKTVMAVIRDISPAAVVGDGIWNVGNHMHTFCKSLDIPFAILLPMGRPDPATGTMSILWMMLRHAGLGKMKQMMSNLGHMNDLMRPVSGEPLPDWQKPIMLLPGTGPLLDTKPAPHELVCGPFLRLPEPREDGGFQRPAMALQASSVSPELQRWLCAEAGKPIVYVAFGTLAKLTEGMVARVAEALRSQPWRVLWVLDGECRETLPSEWRASDDNWRLESWVPQYDVLNFEGVRCFMSHCGANSSLEALSLGIPMVCMPFFCDQFEWADAISGHARAGVQVHKFHSSPADIRAAVQQALEDPALSAAATRVARGMREESRAKFQRIAKTCNDDDIPGVAVAANVILELVEGRDPQRHFAPERSEASCFNVFGNVVGGLCCR